jgi:hypothetical protein
MPQSTGAVDLQLARCFQNLWHATREINKSKVAQNFASLGFHLKYIAEVGSSSVLTWAHLTCI